MEPFVGLTQLLTTQVCTWKDIVEFVTLVHNDVPAMKPSWGLGERLRMAAMGGGGTQRRAWLVACELARAYNGMLAEGGHNLPLDSPDLHEAHDRVHRAATGLVAGRGSGGCRLDSPGPTRGLGQIPGGHARSCPARRDRQAGVAAHAPFRVLASSWPGDGS